MRCQIYFLANLEVEVSLDTKKSLELYKESYLETADGSILFDTNIGNQNSPRANLKNGMQIIAKKA